MYRIKLQDLQYIEQLKIDCAPDHTYLSFKPTNNADMSLLFNTKDDADKVIAQINKYINQSFVIEEAISVEEPYSCCDIEYWLSFFADE